MSGGGFCASGETGNTIIELKMKTPEQIFDDVLWTPSPEKGVAILEAALLESYKAGMTEAAQITRKHRLACSECCDWISEAIINTRDEMKTI